MAVVKSRKKCPVVSCLRCFRKEKFGKDVPPCRLQCDADGGDPKWYQTISRLGFHSMVGRWHISDFSKHVVSSKGLVCAVAIAPLVEYIKRRKREAKTIELADVCVKVGVRSKTRLERADTKYPCIVAIDCENPARKMYRMIDGKHRVHRAVSFNEKAVRCYVVETRELEPFVVLVHAPALPSDAGTAPDSGDTPINEWLRRHSRSL